MHRLRPFSRTALWWAAVVALLTYCAIRYRGALLCFFFLDDFWVMHDAAEVHLNSPLDVVEFFRFGHSGFTLYRPLTTVAYSYLLQTLFAFDATGHHAFQLFVFLAVVALAMAIIWTLTQSRRATLAAGLLFATAPPQAVNAYWLSAFTVTGTAFFLLLNVWCWLRLRGGARVIACTLLQILGLLASEHAAVAPVLLFLVGRVAPTPEPWRRTVLALAPSTLIAVTYLLAKIWYLSPGGRYGVVYVPTLNIGVWLEHLGQYFTACFNVLTLIGPGPLACLLIGVLLGALTLFAAWQSRYANRSWSLIATGIAFFTVSLLPVLVLRTHYKNHYIAVGVLGIIIAVIGVSQLLTRHWQWLILGFSVSLLVVDVVTGGRAWRENETLRYVVNASLRSAVWIQSLQRVAAERGTSVEVLVPRESMTVTIFVTGQAQTYFPSLPGTVVVYDPVRPPEATDGRVVLNVFAGRGTPTEPLPGWLPRWDWLRKLAR